MTTTTGTCYYCTTRNTEVILTSFFAPSFLSRTQPKRHRFCLPCAEKLNIVRNANA